MQPHTVNGPTTGGAPGGPTWILDPYVLLEPEPGGARVTLWHPGKREGGIRYWERISTLPNSEFTVEAGVRATAATVITARQRLAGLFGRLLGRLRGAVGVWVLPTGEPVEPSGERQSVLLVWAEGGTALDECRLQARWPDSNRRQRLGANLYLVAGVPPPEAEPWLDKPGERPQDVAQKLLAAARAAGDVRREAEALADLGAAYLQEGHPVEAVPVLHEARRLADQLGDRRRQCEVLCDLGGAILTGGHQPQQAVEVLTRCVAIASEAGDRFTEKTALERIGLAHSLRRDHAEALAAFGQALELARAVGHRKHQSELLWYLAILYADLGQRERALAAGQEAVDILEKIGAPQASWYAEHLRKYRAGEAAGPLGGAEGRPLLSPEVFVDAESAAGLGQAAPEAAAARGAGLLKMALSATQAMSRFIGSGFKTAPPRTVQHRLRTCAACEHHTGLRCRLCGCFTSAKARLPYEECPIGKWPG
jgi:tetratricopeptide (TPR) repeat protein